MTIKIPPQILISHGCVNCIWRSHGQCPTLDVAQPTGICHEYHEFLLSFDDGSGNVSALFERFNLYLVDFQALRDYNRFMEVTTELEELQKQENPDREAMEQLRARVETHKQWWGRLTKLALDAYAKVVDRDVKTKGSSGDLRLTLQQADEYIEKHMKELEAVQAAEAKLLENKKGD